MQKLNINQGALQTAAKATAGTATATVSRSYNSVGGGFQW